MPDVTASSPAELVPTWIGAISTALGVLLALVAVILTYRQVRQTSRQMREAARREAQDSEAQTRPYLGIDIVPSLSGNGAFDIVIQNFGRTSARDIVLGLADDEFGPQSEHDVIGPALARLFASGFDLAPGARRRVFWRLDDEEGAQPRGDMGAPIVGTVHATYEWWPDDDRSARRYSETIRYDLTEYPKLIPMAGSGPKTEGSSTDVIRRNAVHALRRIAQAVGELQR